MHLTGGINVNMSNDYVLHVWILDDMKFIPDVFTCASAVAPTGSSECILAFEAGSDSGVDRRISRGVAAGATIVMQPGPQPWGHVGTFADPDGRLRMVRSAQSSS